MPHRCGDRRISRDDGRGGTTKKLFQSRSRLVLTQGCIGCLHCSITKPTGLLADKNWDRSLSAAMTKTLASVSGQPSVAELGMNTEVKYLTFLKCRVLTCWSEKV